MKNIRLVTFDAGGTLLYPYPSVGHIYTEVMLRYGLEAGHAEMETAFGRAFRKATSRPRQHGPDAHSDKEWWRAIVFETLREIGYPEDFDAFFEELWLEFAHPRRWRLFDGAVQTLEALRGRGYRLAVLSNWDDRLRPLLEGLRVTPFFEELVISCEVGAEKPDAAIFQVAEARLGERPDAILHVGDSELHDCHGARQAGWRAIRVRHDGRRGGADDEVGCLPELLERLT